MTRSNLTDGELAALAARIQQNYNYDDHSGELVNRKTGKAVRGMKKGGRPYRDLRLNFNGRDTIISMHRAVWAWHHGCFPTLQIDHINGNGFDNHIGNLREVNQSENNMNRLYRWKPNAKTGLPGVNKDRNSYRIFVGHHHYYFRDRFEAFYHLTLLGRRFKLEVRGKW
jgi:hypothetical protein